jgi:hypothetical protein
VRVLADAALEGELGLGVGVVTVAEGEPLVGEHARERLDHLRVELRAGHRAQLGDGRPGRHWLPVGVARGEDVVGVGNRDQPRRQRGISSLPSPNG